MFVKENTLAFEGELFFINVFHSFMLLLLSLED